MADVDAAGASGEPRQARPCSSCGETHCACVACVDRVEGPLKIEQVTGRQRMKRVEISGRAEHAAQMVAALQERAASTALSCRLMAVAEHGFV